ncbi:hypothetical protein JOF57_001719 [Mycolicibacterium lutetiense]|jgi:hypothetical protein|uniref:Uncharacterized protein n=1 Tax=Mycolicibacterium lutetiense TaxID=1641992 RepID=A0ABS4ZQR2_9MYCO|nr:hypothetical protein [Mycolicibacterium lutetiense]
MVQNRITGEKVEFETDDAADAIESLRSTAGNTS